MGMEKQEVIKRPHVMVISMPYQGHISPMLQFSKRLASKGLRVTLIATTDTVKPMEPQASSNMINIEYISYEHDEGQNPKSVDEYIAHMKRKVSENLPIILDKQNRNGNPVNVLVHDSLMPWAIDLGHGLGLKVAQYFTQACTVCAIYYHVYQGKIKTPLKECSDLISLPSLPELEIRELPSDIYVDLYPGASAFMASQFSHLHKADWIFFNTFVELENEVSIFVTRS